MCRPVDRVHDKIRNTYGTTYVVVGVPQTSTSTSTFI